MDNITEKDLCEECGQLFSDVVKIAPSFCNGCQTRTITDFLTVLIETEEEMMLLQEKRRDAMRDLLNKIENGEIGY